VQLLLSQQVDPNSAIFGSGVGSGCKHVALAGLTPLHLIACCSAEVAYVTQNADTLAPEDMLLNAISKARGLEDVFKAAYEQHLRTAADLIADRNNSSSSSSSYKHGADVNARTVVHGETPLTFAAYAGACEVGMLLLAQRADPNVPRLADGSRPLDLAAKFGGASLACALIDKGAEVGWLICCVIDAFWVVLSALIRMGVGARRAATEFAADALNNVSRNALIGSRPLDLAATFIKASLACALIDHGAEVGWQQRCVVDDFCVVLSALVDMAVKA
jgi:ankyrin repeat protein